MSDDSFDNEGRGGVSRRDLLKGAAALGIAAGSPGALAAASPHVQLLTSTSGVFTPPRGKAHYKFSFDFPEPSCEFEGYLLSMRVYTFENTYALDPGRITVSTGANGTMTMRCDRLTWAGGQETAAGHAVLTARREAGGISFEAEATVPGRRMKSIAVIVRGLPRGEISRAGGRFADPHNDEFLASWPDFNAGLVSPIVVLRSGATYTAVSLAARKDEARVSRFYLQPGEQGYRAELTYEREAWSEADTLRTPPWHIRRGSSYDQVARPHYAHVEEAFGLATWESRTDVPAWMRNVSLVTALHGAHWTGYIFNNYSRQLSILRWMAEQIDPAKVLVFLPAWDGRYYWNYPAYEPDPRMGGAEGFAKLIDGAHKLGFHLMAMFGANVANKDAPQYPGIRDALTHRTGGQEWLLDFVDWDNDRYGEGNYGFMNLGVESWRRHLGGRIADTLRRFNLDGYFLDIVGVAENNLEADMSLGTLQLVADLRRQFPDKLVAGEMHYDALLSGIGLFQADVTQGYPEAFYRYGRMFEHLSWPAPGRGSTGVHEFGFSDRNKLPTDSQFVIPTLTVVDDTYTRNRDGMLQVIEVAKRWKFPGLASARA